MKADAIRALIRQRLDDGRLPSDSMPRFWSGPGEGKLCDACDLPVNNGQLVMEGIASKLSDKKPVQFHVICFQLWDHARREPTS